MGGSEKLQVAATYRYLTSPLLELRVLTFYLKSKNLKTQVHTSSSPVAALPNTFGALWKKLWHLMSNLYRPSSTLPFLQLGKVRLLFSPS